MIIEHFIPGKITGLYQQFDEKGRMLPDGLVYINSWINEEVTICYQVMETDYPEKLTEWINNWNDFARFEIVPVISSAEARQKILS